MQHNLKLILILIVVAGIGIMVILGSWLYGSYNQRMELFLATVERTLFDAIQETIQKKEGAGTLFPQPAPREKSRKLFTGAKGLPSHSKKLAAKIMEVYPDINSDSLAMVLDSLLLQERHIFMERRRGIIAARSSSAEPRFRVAMTLEPDAKLQQLLPNFLFGQTPLDSSALLDIEKTFKHGLEDNGVRTDFTLKVIDADRSDMLPSDTSLTTMHIRPLLLDSIAENGLSIRPILIDPEKGKFITVRFNRPWQYLLYNLSWQLMISVALIAIIIGCFVYLFHTIFKQNKLAILKKGFCK
ncbi:hypothetical protein [Parapedobacter tibetensis]|uniref:hypothetical protein n=1 Tax=Parapedobacter tibetensis TaxID=2972951 RepID=UPI00214D2C7B|nr:hypothetical protein [Parapedobacter tibetensis]